jgi:hypothetical protein
MSGTLKRNEHKVERWLRVLLGLVLLTVFLVDHRAWWGLVGIVPLLTGIVGTCPLYSVFGFSTCPRDAPC